MSYEGKRGGVLIFEKMIHGALGGLCIIPGVPETRGNGGMRLWVVRALPINLTLWVLLSD